MTDDLENNQNKPKNKRGGPRPNSGRKKGSTNKISAQEFFTAYRKETNSEYLADLVKRINIAYDDIKNANDKNTRNEAFHIAHKYDSMIAKYLFAEGNTLDITSNGEALKTAFVFPTVELDEWKKVE